MKVEAIKLKALLPFELSELDEIKAKEIEYLESSIYESLEEFYSGPIVYAIGESELKIYDLISSIIDMAFNQEEHLLDKKIKELSKSIALSFLDYFR